MKSFTLKYLTLFLLLLFGVTYSYGQNGCCTNCPQQLPELQSGDIIMTVTGAVNNNLSSPTQGVCGVEIHMTHEYMGDLSLTLTSPGGQTITLMGPIGLYGATDNSTWDITFVPCATTPSPDAGHNGVYTNNDSWGTFGNFTGSYHPHSGCLEDFNSGPVNGNWILHWVDGQASDVGEFFDYNIIFCDQNGVGCSTCNAEGGNIQPGNPVFACLGDPTLNLSLNPTYSGTDVAPDPPGDYAYTYVIV
ncbi:MAG TPA: hypothetical protein ENK85_07755, partial [Saprospiraceae bacterium]|nr:hypothetical protein [Saprospiraceae bacterium]